MSAEARKPEERAEQFTQDLSPSQPLERAVDQFLGQTLDLGQKVTAAVWTGTGLNHLFEKSSHKADAAHPKRDAEKQRESPLLALNKERDEKKPEERGENSTQDLPPTIRPQSQSGPCAAQDPKGTSYDPLLSAMNEKLDQAQKELLELRTKVDELSQKSSHKADAAHPKWDAEKQRESSPPLPPVEWDEYAISSPGPYPTEKTHSPSPHPPAKDHPSGEGRARITPMQAREALRHLREESRAIGGEAPRKEEGLAKEFGQLQHQRNEFFEQTTRVVKDATQLQQDQRLHPERAVKDEETLRHDWRVLRKDKETVRHTAQSLERDAARFGEEHPELRKQGAFLAQEAHREGRDLPPVPSDPASRPGFHPQSHAQKAMEALRQKGKESHSPTCLIVTQAGRHVHLFERTRKELLTLHKKYGEDLVRAQKDKALHPEEWKRLRDDRKRLARDQMAIDKQEQTLGRESHAIGAFAQEIGKEDPSLRKSAQSLSQQVQSETRDAHRFLPGVPSRQPRGGGRDR
ncbi:hypothetical protein [Methylacidimicrobium tartarophylax]|uniref:Uncharacterized protein n=1 Tax=Methylacidimicrobium tartarophylax TaxID=1041768 RepID=A0A5E6MPW3_9BACT|nr:hypothetical protein [Methylacidimicrobium tartarophylax]VVM07530.1 hypothetical protein MAMT_01788 [Methylacidimicrobium tartarophylax]